MADQPYLYLDLGKIDQATQDVLSDYLAGMVTRAGNWDPNQKMWIVPYTFESEKHWDWSKEAKDVLPMAVRPGTRPEIRDKILAMQKAVRTDHKTVERVANIRHVPAFHVDQRDHAAMRYFIGRPSDEYLKKLKKDEKPWNGITDNFHYERDVVINIDRYKPEDFEVGKPGYDTVVHENGHGRGLGHPGAKGRGGTAGGDNPNHSRYNMIMSYFDGNENPNVVRDIFGLSPNDVMGYQALYGEAKPSAQWPSVLSAAELGRISTLWRKDGEVSFDLSNSDQKGNFTVDMAMQRNGNINPISGFLDNPDKSTTVVGIRGTPGMHVKAIHANKAISLYVKTSPDRPNTVAGSDVADTFELIGNNHIVTTGKGEDIVSLTRAWKDERRDTGTNNLVTDFNVAEDRLQISGIDGKVMLQETADHKGTDVLITGKDGKVVASVALKNDVTPVLPQEVKAALARTDPGLSVTIQTPNATPVLPAPIVPRGPRK